MSQKKKAQKTTTTTTTTTKNSDVDVRVSSLILSILQNDGPCTKKQLRNSILANDDSIRKSTVRKAIQELLVNQTIQQQWVVLPVVLVP